MMAATGPGEPGTDPQPAEPASGRRARRLATRSRSPQRTRGSRLAAVVVVGAVVAGACSAATSTAVAPGGPNGTGAGPASAPVAAPNLQLAAALEPFSACDQLLDYVKQAALARVGPYGLRNGANVYENDTGATAQIPQSADRSTATEAGPPATAVPDAPGAPAAGDSASPSAGQTPTSAPASPTPDAAAHSDTNVQEKGVDEPDTVKTDGKRILALSSGKLLDVDVTGTAPRNAGSIALPGGGAGQILLSGDHVLVIDANAPIVEPATSGASRSRASGTLLSLIDISKPEEMKILSNVRIDGRFVSARMVDGQARVVTTSTPAPLPFVNPSSSSALAQQAAEDANHRIIESSKIEDWLPDAHIGNGTNPTTRQLLDCAKVSHPKTFSGFSVLSIVSVDLNASDVNPADAVGVMADGQTVYASKTNLYVATPAYYDVPRNPSRVPGTATVPTTAPPAAIPLRNATSIHKFSIEARGPAVYRASGDVDGTILSQYSLSEDDGFLRVATTTAPSGSRGCTRCNGTESFVRVLQETNGELVQVGQVGNLGRGEQIKAVRFIAKQAYVVTFRQTDPLYTLDLADARAPRVVGELKLLGYSAYLHPMGDNLIIGIGQDATTQGRSLGTKVSVFDVADLANPRELQKYVLWNSTSAVEQDFHAFLYWEPTKLAMIPVDRAYVGFIGGDCPAPEPRPSGAAGQPATTAAPNPEGCVPRQYIPPFTGALGLTLDRHGIAELGRIVNPAATRSYTPCVASNGPTTGPISGGTAGVRDGGCGSPCPPDAMCTGEATPTGANGGGAPTAVDCSKQVCVEVTPTTETTIPTPTPACGPTQDCATPAPVPPVCPSATTKRATSGPCGATATGAAIERSLVVGDTLYTLSTNGLKSSALSDLHEKYWLPFFA